MKRIYCSFNRIAVHHARNLLAADGIACEVRNEYLASAMGEMPPAECQAELWILRDIDEPRAARILQQPQPCEPEWTCSCGERLGAQFTQCWYCGAFRAS